MIKTIISLLSLLWVLLAGTPNQPVNDLRKQPYKKSFKRNLHNWIEMNKGYFALAAILIGLIFFAWFCFWVCGLSATESGTIYNHLGGVI